MTTKTLTTFLFAALILAASCNSNHKNEKQSAENAVAPKDTVFVSVTDSLDWIIKTGTADMKRQAYDNIFTKFIYNDAHKVIEYSFQEIAFAKKENRLDIQAEALYNMAYAHHIINEMDSALYYYEAANAIWQQLHDTINIVLSWNRIGTMQAYLNRPVESIENLKKALEYYQRTGDKEKMSSTLSSIANAYSSMGIYQKFIENYLQAIKLQEEINDTIGLGISYCNLCTKLPDIGNYKDAIMYGEKSIATFQLAGNTYYKGLALLRTCQAIINAPNNIKEINWKTKLFNYLDEVSIIANTINNEQMKYEILVSKSEYENLMHNYEKAKSIAERVLALTDTSRINTMKAAYMLLLNASIGNNEDASFYLGKFNEYNKKLQQQEWTDKISEMEVKYETEKKELEIERQQHIIKSQNLQRILLAGGVAVSAVFLLLLWRLLYLRNRRNAALAEMNATKDKFFSIISHDLKNPAIAQRDALQLLIKNTGQWDVSALEKYYDGLLETAEGQVELVYNLLNWAQIQIGKMTYTPATFNLFARLRPDILMIRKMAENKEITFIADIPEEATIFGDSNMLGIVIRNLLTNAVKFTPKGGTVTLKATPNPSKGEEFSLPFGEGRGGACISITDTGIGMSEGKSKICLN